MTAALMPARPQRSSSSGMNCAGMMRMARSAGSGSSATDWIGLAPLHLGRAAAHRIDRARVRVAEHHFQDAAAQPVVSDEAPTTATVFGQSSFAMSGTGAPVHRSPRPRAMMPRRISVVPPWMVSLGATFRAKASCSSSVTRLLASGLEKRAEFAHALGQFLLPDGADVLDDGGFDHRLLAGLQHAGDRHRHAPQRVQLRHQPAEAFGAAQIGIGAERAHQFGEHVEGLQEAFRPAALIGELAGRLLPGAVDLAEHVIVGNEGVVEHDLVEVVLAGHLDRSD